MHCRLASQVLNAELDFLAPVIKDRPVQPPTIRFATSSNGTLSMAAFDGHVDLRTEVRVDDAIEGMASTRAGMVRAMAKLLPKGDVILDGSKTHVAMGWKDGSSKFPTSSAWLLKPLSGTPMIDMTLPAATLADMITNAQFAISDTFGGRIPGVLLEVTADLVRLVASDGFSLAVSERPIANGQPASMVLPLTAMVSIRAMLTSGSVRLLVVNDTLQVSTDSRQLMTRAASGTFPKYQVMIPAVTGAGATFHRGDLSDTVQRVVLGGDDMFAQAVLTITTDSVDIRCGECHETLSCVYGDAPYTVRFDAKRLRGVLAATKADRLTLFTENPREPQLFQPAGRADVRLVLMPINR